ncbi:MAG: fructosamine kinase family protein [Planctomycetota bacterium]
MSSARLSRRGAAIFEDQLADLTLQMHAVHGAGYGSPLDDKLQTDWRDVYTPAFERAYQRVRDQVSSAARWAFDDLVKRVPSLIPANPTPQLVLGDLWANNILVDDAHPDRPTITGLIDPSPLFADVEYKLAYLQLFKTVSDRFFERYNQKRPIRVGFHRRREIDWLGTMLEHVDRFGDQRLASIEELARRAWWYGPRD